MKVENIILDRDEKETILNFADLLRDICCRVNGQYNCEGDDCQYHSICSGGVDNSINDFCNVLSDFFNTKIKIER